MKQALLEGNTSRPESRLERIDSKDEKTRKNGIPRKKHPYAERVNEVTFKITDGTETNTPACHGHWPGFRTTKALAWVIQIAPGHWLARCRDKASGPATFQEAKRAAIAMVREGKRATGDYTITDPIGHLNTLAAHLLRDAQ